MTSSSSSAGRAVHAERPSEGRPGPEGDETPPGRGGAPDAAGTVTELLAEASGGNTDALNRLLPLVYDELRTLARGRLRGERPDHTLNPTALVHEAYVVLVDQTRVEWQNRSHFYAVASQAMRRILLNHADMRNAAKRGGGSAHVTLDGDGIGTGDHDVLELLAVNDALERLAAFNPRGADVVTYRFFAGLSHDEIARVMGTSEATVRRAWRVSKTWLKRELRAGGTDAAGGSRDAP